MRLLMSLPCLTKLILGATVATSFMFNAAYASTADDTIASITANSEASSTPAMESSTSSVYFSLGKVNFDRDVSSAEEIDRSATYWRLGYEQQFNAFILGAGFSSYAYDDLRDESATNVNLPGSDDVTSVAMNLYGEAGYHYPINLLWSLSMVGGYEMVTSSQRGYAKCEECLASDINIDGGFYMQPRIRANFSSGFYLVGSLNHYISGDASNGLLLTVGTVF